MKKLLSFFTKQKKVIGDLLLNMVAYGVPVLVNQILVLPLINHFTDENTYGYILTIVSLFSLIPHTLGASLTTSRLVAAKHYGDESSAGDFSILFTISELVGVVAFVIGWFIYTEDRSFLRLALLVIACILWLAREYAIVIYRLRINYKRICINSLIFSGGYLVGVLLFGLGWLGTYWEIIYIIGQASSLIYTVVSSGMLKEARVRTKQLWNTSVSYVKLLGAAIINSVGDNMDKMLIFSMLGGASVSVFYAASVFTKIISLAVTPINGVVLSYLSKKKDMSSKIMALIVAGAAIVGLVGYGICILIAKPVIWLLYREYLNEAIKYVHLTSAYTMLRLGYAMLRPFLLMFRNLNWEIAGNIITVTSYISLALLLVPRMGIMGMCISYVVGGAIRIGLVLVAFFGKAIKDKAYGKKKLTIKRMVE